MNALNPAIKPGSFMLHIYTYSELSHPPITISYASDSTSLGKAARAMWTSLQARMENTKSGADGTVLTQAVS